MVFRRAAALLLLSAPLFASAARADVSDADRATARNLAEEGKDALARGDFAGAEDRFHRADELIHAPTLLLGRARALVGLGKLVAADESYERIVREGAPPGSPDPFFAAIEAARVELAAIKPRIAWVTIHVSAANASSADHLASKVSIDGVAVPEAALDEKRAVDAGKHVVHAEAPKFAPKEASFTVVEGGTESVSIALESQPQDTLPIAPVPSAKDNARPPVRSTSTARTIGFVGLGVGAVGLVFGGVTGALALSKKGSLNTECPTGTCPKGANGNLDTYHTMATLSTATLIAGGILAAGGMVLIVTAPKKAPPVVTTVGLGSLALEVAF